METYSVDTTLRILGKAQQEDIHYLLTHGEKKDAPTRKGTPFFFYQSSIFSSPHRKGKENIPSHREYYTKCKKTDELTPLHLSLLEYMFKSSSYLGSNYHKLKGKIRVNAIENLVFSLSGSTNNNKTRAEVVFKKLFSTLVTIYEIDEDAEKMIKAFPIFDDLKYNEIEEVYEYTFSDSVSFIYAIEPLVSHQAIQILHDYSFSPVMSYFINYTATLNKEIKHISIPNLAVEMDYLPEDRDVRAELFEGLSDFLCQRGSGKRKGVLSSAYGLKLDEEMPRGKEVFLLPRHSKKPVVMIDDKTTSFVDCILTDGDMESYAFLNSSESVSSEEEIERRVEERLQEEVQFALAKRKREYVDFSELTIEKYSHIGDIANEYGYNKAEAIVILAGYCDWHEERGVQQSKDRFILKWREWLENSTKDPRNKIQNKRKKEINAPNKGSAKNIVLDEKIKEVYRNKSVDDVDGIEYFTKFKNYYLSIDGFAVDWIPRFENWVIDSMKRASEDTLKRGNSVIENNFYYARIVSEEIKGFIESSGYSITDVLNGDVEFEEISYKSFPIPAKFGKGLETLFSFKDKARNDKILNRYATPHQIDKVDIRQIEAVNEGGDYIEGEIDVK